MPKIKRVIAFIIFSLLILLLYVTYTYKSFPFNHNGNLNCNLGEYVKRCKLGPCCCPVGALCDWKKDI